MHQPSEPRVTPPGRGRDGAASPLEDLSRRISQMEERQFDLLRSVAEAEERGDWALAAQLRSRRLAERATARRLMEG